MAKIYLPSNSPAILVLWEPNHVPKFRRDSGGGANIGGEKKSRFLTNKSRISETVQDRARVTTEH